MRAVAPVALVGMMASGKTTVGRMVADRLGRRFVDTDDEILERTGRTVKELWEEGGESAYRDLERDVTLEALCSEEGSVIGVPGGAVLDEEVRSALGAPGVVVVFLRARPRTLAGRVAPDDHRPLLRPDPLVAFRRMERERRAVYERIADTVVDVDDRVVADLVDEVLEAVEDASDRASWIIDGNNVMGAAGDGWWNDRPKAAARLTQQVAEWCRTHDSVVTLVFDGRAVPEVARLAGGNLSVRFADRTGRDAADDRIVEMVSDAAGQPTLTVVTSDKGLAKRLPAAAQVMGSRSFRRMLGLGTG